MTFLDEVRAKRQKLADVLLDDDYSGIREIVEELYPDRAHFIYELLQNAEDAGATEASFTLQSDRLVFEHNGLTFTDDDVWGITNIGKAKKRDQKDKIGRFGVGFKAVFAYSETPHIWSPTYSFKISDLVLPTALQPKPELGTRTRFEFPFNSPKKGKSDAYAEIEAGLGELAETTLLFLTHLASIRWQMGQALPGEVGRIQHSEHHFEVLKRSGERTTASSHFLKFDQPVEGLENRRVAVAFALDLLPNVLRFDREKPLAKQLKIIPSIPGRVAVFFPAQKETSGLRFHLHAPFVPELSRASIKETPANRPLFQQLATLTAAALHQIRDMNLLSAEFLAALPNPQDEVPYRYAGIRTVIVDEMNTKPLTPTHAKSHAPARSLLQSRASLKELLTPMDLAFLVDHDEEPRHWVVSAAQKNSNADRFLSGLAINGWDFDEFVAVLDERASVEGVPDKKFEAWLSTKPMEWHQQLYALLFSEYLSEGPTWKKGRRVDALKPLRIVRLSDGNYSVGSRCFYPGTGGEHGDVLPRVDSRVYTSGKSKPQQANAKQCLAEMGVREVGEAEQVEAILKHRYSEGLKVLDEKTYREDLRRFISLTEMEPDKAALFPAYFIFLRTDNRWAKPGNVFLDKPFLDTGLTAYYDAFGEGAERVPLAERYKDRGVAPKGLARFAVDVGVQTVLEVRPQRCSRNPSWPMLRSGDTIKRSNDSYGRVDSDFDVPAFEILLELRSYAASRLIWITMKDVVKPGHLLARWQRNNHSRLETSPSRLVHRLLATAWIPQADGQFVEPRQAERLQLPEGFPFDPGWPWIKAIGFGEDVTQRSDDQHRKLAAAKELGFSDNDSLERAKRFVTLPREDQKRILEDWERRAISELPDHEPADPVRRADVIVHQARDAPGRRTEERTRHVDPDLESIKQEAEQYLRGQYTSPDGEMICQVCKAPLPFKLDNGRDYFEKVELLPELKKRHYQNYLALCPNHAAMFLYANGSREVIKDGILEMEQKDLRIILAQRDTTIYFTKTHIADLKKIIEVDLVEGIEAPRYEGIAGGNR